MKLNLIKKSIVLIGVFTLFLLGVNNASALTISPVRIEVNGDPGTTIIKEITLLNDNQVAGETFYVSYSNFEAQGETGSPLFVEPKSGLGTWMDAGEVITLAPAESKTIPLKITIPDDVYAGGYFAVVFFGTNPNSGDGGQVTVGAKTGTLVLLSVNGDVLEAGGLVGFNTLKNQIFFNSLPVSFQYRFKNDGNDRVKPEGKITLRNLFYLPSARLDANAVSGNILPHSTRLFNVDWIKYSRDKNYVPPTSFINSFIDKVSYQWKNFAVGPYLARLNIVYGMQDLESSKTVFLFIFPWQLLICLALLFIIVFWIGKKLLRRYNKHIIEKARANMINTNNDANNI